jgi:hypothetical protein
MLTQHVETKILMLRGQKVLLSTHLAELYGVLPKALVQAVKRNAERFPADFMFQLTDAEFANLKSQTVTSSWGGQRRAAPYAFTEQGVSMLSIARGSSASLTIRSRSSATLTIADQVPTRTGPRRRRAASAPLRRMFQRKRRTHSWDKASRCIRHAISSSFGQIRC